MEWIKIDKDNLPKNEVLAGNFKKESFDYREKLIGWIRINYKGIICCESHELLKDCTHYIDIHKFNPTEE